MSQYEPVSIREYLESQCDNAGVGFEAVTDRDIGFALLAPDYGSQWTAIRDILQRNQEAEDEASTRIREREASTHGSSFLVDFWIDQMHDKAFQDAAHSMAAIGLIAPMMESLFSRIVHYFFRDEKAWERMRRKHNGIAGAILWSSEYLDLRKHLPDDLGITVSALFAYRNKMFHCGLEWPERQRINFAKRIDSDGWTNCFSRAESGDDPWFFYMTRDFVERCLDTIYEIIDAVGAYARPLVWDNEDPFTPARIVSV